MTAAEVVQKMRYGAIPSGYVAAVYAARRRRLYQQERRWPARPFWRMRHDEE
jgi:hypothetical protein